MQIFKTARSVTRFSEDKREKGKLIGFVPTMGALHKGHISILEKAKRENDFTVCSIYINPLQFNNSKDFNTYPRNFTSDVQMLEDAGCDVLFFPDDNIVGDASHFKYDIGYLDTIMEGLHRPGHFKGVAYIVNKLFEIVKPHRAYFGLKDYQQWAVINKLATDFEMDIELIPCETVREDSGLAMSSRNSRLTSEGRKQASIIYKALCFIKEQAKKDTIENVKIKFCDIIKQNAQMKIEYIDICDAFSLKPLKNWDEADSAVAFTAVSFQNVRLIDNIILF